MIYYICLAVLSVLLGLKVQNNSIYGEIHAGERQRHINRAFSFAVFFALAFFSGTRVATGNDFWVYRLNFELIAQQRVVSSEIGFNLIVRIVQWFAGYDNYMPIFFVFSVITVFFFIKAIYDESEWFSASLFLLLANGFYFSSLNTVRYYLALAMALYAMKFVNKDRHLAFLSLVLIGATIHKTLFITVPFYYLARINYKKRDIPIFACLAAALVFLREPIRKLIFIIYPYYEGTYLDDYQISYVNILKAVAVLVFSLIYYKKAIRDDKINRFYFNLNIGALIVFSCLWYLPESTRIGYYLSISNIFLLPSIIKKIDDKKQKIFWTTVIALAYAVFFIMYLRTLYATNIRLLPYTNWFFAQ